MLDEIYFRHEDTNDDGIDDTLCIYSKDYSIPLIGDYRGVEVARIKYIASRHDSVNYAESLAKKIVVLLQQEEIDG